MNSYVIVEEHFQIVSIVTGQCFDKLNFQSFKTQTGQLAD